MVLLVSVMVSVIVPASSTVTAPVSENTTLTVVRLIRGSHCASAIAVAPINCMRVTVFCGASSKIRYHAAKVPAHHPREPIGVVRILSQTARADRDRSANRCLPGSSPCNWLSLRASCSTPTRLHATVFMFMYGDPV